MAHILRTKHIYNSTSYVTDASNSNLPKRKPYSCRVPTHTSQVKQNVVSVCKLKDRVKHHFKANVTYFMQFNCSLNKDRHSNNQATHNCSNCD